MPFPNIFFPRKAVPWRVYSLGCVDSRFRANTRSMVRKAFGVRPAEVVSCFDFGGAAAFQFEHPEVVKSLLAKITYAVEQGAEDVIITAHTMGCRYVKHNGVAFKHPDEEFRYTMGLVRKAVARIGKHLPKARVWGAVLVKHPTQSGVYFEWLDNNHP